MEPKEMFKIVEVLGRGKPQLYIIPGSWETNDELYWPISQVEKFMKDPKSTPGESWFQIPYTLKRSRLATLEAAERELQKLLQCQDTGDPDTVPEMPLISNAKRKKKRNAGITLCENFNSAAESCVEVVPPAVSTCRVSNSQVTPPVSAQTKSASLNQSDSPHISEIASDIITIDESKQSFEAPAIMHTISSHIPQLPYMPHQSTVMSSHQSNESFLPHNTDQFDLTTTSASTKDPLMVQDIFEEVPVFDPNHNYGKILKNQETIMQNQVIILNQLASFTVMFENLTKRLDKIENNRVAEQLAHKQAEIDVKDFKPINSLQELASLDEKLKEEAYMELLLEKLSYVCGKTGREHGINVSYTLVDKLFTRRFMTECSWAGGSRGEREKVPFKIYKNVINLFFKLVCLADNQFTLENCENFFKMVLKNSTRRNEVKETSSRRSKCKRRPNKLSYKLKKLDERYGSSANYSESEKNKENFSANNSDLENNDEPEMVFIKIDSDQDVLE